MPIKEVADEWLDLHNLTGYVRDVAGTAFISCGARVYLLKLWLATG
jgi:hypothetical protein